MMRNKYHEQLELSEWMVELCEKVIDRSMVSTGILSLTLPVFSYLTTVLSYAFVALVLFRRRHDRRSVSSKQKDHSATWRLGVHMGVFTLSFCFMALAYIATFPMVFIRLHICLFNVLQADSCLNWSDELIAQHTRYIQNNGTSAINTLSGKQESEECHLEHIYAFTRYVSLTATASVGWFFRMCIDAVIDFVSPCTFDKDG